jgi:hypothetical protein
MSRSQDRSERSLDAGGQWHNPLPPALRIAAELHFGTWIFVAVVAALKEGPGPGIFMLLIAGLASGLTHTRGANSRASWWTLVVMMTVLGAFLCVVVVTV